MPDVETTPGDMLASVVRDVETTPGDMLASVVRGVSKSKWGLINREI